MKEQIKARMRSFVFAGNGIAHALKTQPNARIHALATAVVALAGWWASLSGWEWTVVLLSVGMVWVAELLNTALERVVDLASPGQHELARFAKDSAAGGVLIAAVIAVLVGAIVFLPKILNLWI